jgi:hypothetical protein
MAQSVIDSEACCPVLQGDQSKRAFSDKRKLRGLTMALISRTGPGKGKRYWYTPEDENGNKQKGLELPQREKRIFETKTIVCGRFSLHVIWPI